MIIKMLSYSLVNLFCCWNHSVHKESWAYFVTVVLINCIKIGRQFPLGFYRFILFNQQKLHILPVKSVTQKNFLNWIVSYDTYHLFGNIDKMQGSHLKFSATAIIISQEVIIARCEAILNGHPQPIRVWESL